MKSELCEVCLDDERKPATVVKPECSDYVKNGFKRIYRSQNGNDVYKIAQARTIFLEQQQRETIS